MPGAVPTFGLVRAGAFVRAASRYWLRVFPAVSRELRRRRELALEIGDPTLRRVALQALECKRCNLEGAAAFELLAGRFSAARLVRALCACQTMCDYLDLLSEQPVADPVANGGRLHEALLAALAPERAVRGGAYYYAHSSRRDDGGYLQTLIDDVRGTLAALPAQPIVRAPLRRTAERIAAYQSFNHGDARGSYAAFEHWASTQGSPADGLTWWETGGGAGSTLTAFALIASAADPRLGADDALAIERAYFPWIGALHSLLDSLVDHHEDLLTGNRGLLACYRSPEQAARRMRWIALRALDLAHTLPRGRRHGLLLAAMTGFYLCEARRLDSEHVRAVKPALLQAAGALARTAMLMMDARHAARRPSSQRALPAAAR